MFKSLLLLFLIINKKKTSIIVNSNNILKINIEQNLTINDQIGCDGRYNNSKNNDYENIDKIKMNFNKLHLLKKLEDSSISINYKLKLIDNLKLIDVVNITKGGLFDDWNFKIKK